MKRHLSGWIAVLVLLPLCTALAAAQNITPRSGGADPAEQREAKGEAADRQGESSARDLYFAGDTSGAKFRPALRVKLYQQVSDGDECGFVQVPADKAFRAGDALRFSVESNCAGYLYIVQKGSSGRQTLLFPHPQINGGDNRFQRGDELVIPGRNWFRLDDNPGTEEISFVFSRKKIDLIPYVDSAPSATAGPPAGSVEESVLDILQERSASKDLVLTTNASQPAPPSAGGAVYNSLFGVNAGASGKNVCVLKIKLKHK